MRADGVDSIELRLNRRQHAGGELRIACRSRLLSEERESVQRYGHRY